MTLRRIAIHALVLAALTPTALTGQDGRSIVIDRFHADITIRPNGTTRIVETLDVDFQGEWNGIERDISLRHTTADGRRSRLLLEVLEITDGAGRPLRHEAGTAWGVLPLRVWVPGARDARRTVVITYEVTNVLRFVEDDTYRVGGHDELYWNVTGTDWEMPIRTAAADIRLPEGAADVEAWGYTGRAGSREQDARVEVGDDGAVRVTSTRPFAEREGLTVSVAWAPGAVDRAAVPETPGMLRFAMQWLLRDTRILIFPLGMLALLVGTFVGRKGLIRDQDRRRSITVAYEPPGDLSPAETGTLVHRTPRPSDITSTLVDLAVRGHLMIEEIETKRLFGLTKKTDYVLHLKTPRSGWDDLAPHEKQYMNALFRHRRPLGLIRGWGDWKRELEAARVEAEAEGRTLGKQDKTRALQRFYGMNGEAKDRTAVRLSSLRGHLGSDMFSIQQALTRRLEERGLLRTRGRLNRAAESLLGMLPFMALFAAFAWFIVANGTPIDMDPVTTGVALMIAAAVMIVGGPVLHNRIARTARSTEGVRTLEQALGFKEFLARVETPRYRRMITSPEMFERYLPYAMAFRVEDRWAKAFDDLYDAAPAWYVGSGRGRFRASDMTRGLGRMSRQAGRAMGSGASGGRSGSGGGGRSGGGSGGGGGRGF